MPRLAPLAPAVLALAMLSSCLTPSEPTWQPVREERFVRIDAARDRVEWIEIQHGLGGRTLDFSAHLREVLACQRVFPAAGGWLSLNLDGPEMHTSHPVDPDAATKFMLDTLQVGDARLVVDENGCVSLWRAGSLDRASLWLPDSGGERGPTQLYSIALYWLAPPFDPVHVDPLHFDPCDALNDGEFLDSRTMEMLERAGAAGERFWSLRGDSLCLDAPMTSSSSARFLSFLCGWFRPETVDAHLGLSLRELDTTNERLRARFGPDESGWIRVAWTHEERLDDPILWEQRARDLGFAVDSRESYLERRRAAGLPEPRVAAAPAGR